MADTAAPPFLCSCFSRSEGDKGGEPSDDIDDDCRDEEIEVSFVLCLVVAKLVLLLLRWEFCFWASVLLGSKLEVDMSAKTSAAYFRF